MIEIVGSIETVGSIEIVGLIKIVSAADIVSDYQAAASVGSLVSRESMSVEIRSPSE